MQEDAKLKTADSAVRTIETHRSQSSCDNDEDNKLHSAKKLTYTFSTQPLETDLKKLLTQVTGKIDLNIVTEVKLKVVSGHAGLHRLSYYTPRLRILTLDGSCVSSFRDLGSSLKALEVLSVARCNMKHLDGVSGFRNLQELNVRENLVSDPSPCSSVENLSKLDLSRNQITDVSYFAFLRSNRKLRELDVSENRFSDYKEEIRTLLPQLKILDGEEFEDSLRPEAALEEGEDLSSEDESSTSLSSPVEDMDLEETKILQEEEEEEEEDPGENVFQAHPSIDDSESSNNGDKITAHETQSGKLSSGRLICGNLAVSLRGRNPTKSPRLAVPLEIKEDTKLRENERSQNNLQREEKNSETNN